MLLAELNIRHSRRHMPTRRVALDGCYLPTSGPAYGAMLLGAVVGEFLPRLGEEPRELFPLLLHSARDGLGVPRIALRYRLQTDTHGLDRSRHRILDEAGNPAHARLVLELDTHAAPDPQVIGAVMAAASLGGVARHLALDAVSRAIRRPHLLVPPRVSVRWLVTGLPGVRIPYAEAGTRRGAAPGSRSVGDRWASVPAERRWAMEVFGFTAGAEVELGELQRRYRRLLRVAHPDHGADRLGAAERIAELRAARETLLDVPAAAAEESLR